MKYLKTFKLFESTEPTLDDVYDLLPSDIIEYIDFLEKNVGAIKDIYQNKFYRNGGWNGLMDSINYVEKKEKYKVPDLDIEIPGFPDIDLSTLIYNNIF
jgi:hypothetical protein